MNNEQLIVEDSVELPGGIGHWTVAAIVLWMAHQLIKIFRSQRAVKKEVLELKSLVEMFLRPRIVFLIGNQVTRRIKMKDTEKAVASLEVDDAKGFPTGGAFDQPPVWAIDDETIASLNVSADGLTCEVVAQKPGNAQLTVAGVAAGQSYQGACPVVVVAGDAATIKVTLGDAIPQ